MSRTLQACMLAAALALPACVSQDQYRDCLSANAALQSQLADMKNHQADLERENKRLTDAVGTLSRTAKDAQWVEEQKARLAELLKQVEGMGGDVKVRETPEGVAFDLQGEVLFDSGKAEITSRGREVLGRLLPTLSKSGKNLRVDGHTDTDPIRMSAWKNNLRLSIERSMAVAEFLRGAGFPAEKVAVAGFGEFKPAVGGDTANSKQQNRRVEILMLRQ